MPNDEDDDINSFENYDSGPFCVHWDDPGTCNELCQCGHTCAAHPLGEGCDDCDCKAFKDKETP